MFRFPEKIFTLPLCIKALSGSVVAEVAHDYEGCVVAEDAKIHALNPCVKSHRI